MDPKQEYIDLRTKYHCSLSGNELDEAVSNLVFHVGFFFMVLHARGLEDEVVKQAWKNLVQDSYKLAGIYPG